MTMLGVKWSPISRQALDLVDCVEVSGWTMDGVDRSCPVYLHNIDLDFSLARPGVIDADWIARARAAIDSVDSPWLSLHLGFSAEEVYCTDHMLPNSEVLDREACRERFLSGLRNVKNGIGVPLLVENLDYCPEGAYEHICDPVFIREMVDELDCGLLLDLAHAQVSADWLGVGIEQYLAGLPLERVMQIHLSSPRRVGDRLDDAHCELVASDLQLLEGVLGRCQPEVVLLEYTRDASELRAQLAEIREVMGNRSW